LNSAIELTLAQSFDFLLHVAVVRPVFLWGAPGIGKTALVNRFATAVGLECVFGQPTGAGGSAGRAKNRRRLLAAWDRPSKRRGAGSSRPPGRHAS
jgi:predicted ATPase